MVVKERGGGRASPRQSWKQRARSREREGVVCELKRVFQCGGGSKAWANGILTGEE